MKLHKYYDKRAPWIGMFCKWFHWSIIFCNNQRENLAAVSAVLMGLSNYSPKRLTEGNLYQKMRRQFLQFIAMDYLEESKIISGAIQASLLDLLKIVEQATCPWKPTKKSFPITLYYLIYLQLLWRNSFRFDCIGVLTVPLHEIMDGRTFFLKKM